MNKIILIALTIFLSTQLYGQTEFETYKNGLIYSETTMNKLRHIVDSLNLKYKICEFNKVFNSKLQTIGHIIRLDTNDVKQAKKDMENNISFENFITKYPKAKIDRNVLVVKSKYKNYEEKEVVEFSEVDLRSDYGFEINRYNENNLYSKPLKNSWLFDYVDKSEYSKESINAFYLPEDFKTIPLNLKYSRQIGYSDCLIDTVATKFKDNTKEGWVDLPKNWQTLSEEKKVKLLDEMRSTKVVGGCSQDSGPRDHAINIAILSAETTNWAVFLKSHLDIMNDRFDRMSDGSYAYAQRKTYIKELEELDINVPELLIGISLRVENPAQNHYYGSIGRLGRAISESNNKNEFMTQILSMIEDNKLDNYNRILSYFLYVSCNNYIENKDVQISNLKLLEKSIMTLPVYLKDKIKLTQG